MRWLNDAMQWIAPYVTLRTAVIGEALIISAGRLGLLNVGSPTLIPKMLYGVMFLAAAIWLMATWRNGRRYGWFGRLGAVFAFACFVSLGADVMPAWASSLMLWWWSALALSEAVTWREC